MTASRMGALTLKMILAIWAAAGVTMFAWKALRQLGAPSADTGILSALNGHVSINEPFVCIGEDGKEMAQDADLTGLWISRIGPGRYRCGRAAPH